MEVSRVGMVQAKLRGKEVLGKQELMDLAEASNLSHNFIRGACSFLSASRAVSAAAAHLPRWLHVVQRGVADACTCIIFLV